MSNANHPDSAKADADRRLAALAATVPAVGELGDGPDWRKADADADALFRILMGQAATVRPNVHAPWLPAVDGKPERQARWQSLLVERMGADGVEGAHEEALVIREMLFGPKRNHVLMAHGPERDEQAKRDGHQERRMPCWTPLITVLAAAKKLQREWDRQNASTARRLQREIEADQRRRKRELERTVADLRSGRDHIGAAIQRATALASDRAKARVRTGVSARVAMAMAAAEEVASRNQIARASLAKARAAQRVVRDQRPAAAKMRLRIAAQPLLALARSNHADSQRKLDTATSAMVAARKARKRFVRRADEAIGAWRGTESRPMGAFMDYLARQRKEATADPANAAAIAALDRVYDTARGRLAKAGRDDRYAELAKNLPAEVPPDPNATTPGGRDWRDVIAPRRHRHEARAAVRAGAEAGGDAEDSKWDAMPDADADVDTPTRQAADALMREALGDHLDIAIGVLRRRKSAEQIKHQTPLRVLECDQGPDAQLAYAPDDCDLSSPRAFAESFVRDLPEPKENLARLCGGAAKGSWHRWEHAVLSVPVGVGPIAESNAALVGGMAMRLRLVGMDVRHHRAAFYVHRDKDHTHIHAVVDRVRDDGRIWGMNGISLTAAMTAAGNLANALFLRERGQTSYDPCFAAPVAREAHAHRKSMAALGELARGEMRCRLVWQERAEDGKIHYSAEKSPFHGGDTDEEEDSARELFGRKAIREAMELAGHLGMCPGFAKIDDDVRTSLAEALKHEKTTNSDQSSWRYEVGEVRPVRFLEHLAKKLGIV